MASSYLRCLLLLPLVLLSWSLVSGCGDDATAPGGNSTTGEPGSSEGTTTAGTEISRSGTTDSGTGTSTGPGGSTSTTSGIGGGSSVTSTTSGTGTGPTGVIPTDSESSSSSSSSLECTPNARFCDGDDVVTCSPQGSEASREACTPLVCEVGVCKCTGDEQCDSDEYCTSAGECVAQVCTPGARTCQGDSVQVCDSRGAVRSFERQCPPGTCADGVCACSGAQECFDGETCDAGVCTCTSELYCGPDSTCCPEGWLCQRTEVCDDQGVCTEGSRCAPDCGDQVRCGLQGEVCCTEERPICGAESTCLPDCGANASACGETCCAAGSWCIWGACIEAEVPCTRFTDCGFGEYCEEVIGRCLPIPDSPEGECREEGEFLALEVREKWENETDEVISTPVVGDVTGDGRPNLVYNASRIGGDWVLGEVVILEGETGDEILRVSHDTANGQYGSQGRSTIALGDVTGDGVLDIIYASRVVSSSRSWIVAVDGSGQTLWRARDRDGDLVTTRVVNGAVTVARFGHDERAWSIVGAMIIDPDGRVVFNPGGDAGAYGSNSGYVGGVAVVADLTGDGYPDISIGRRAYSVRVEEEPHEDGWPDVRVEELWTFGNSSDDGYTAVADMYGDGLPEVVLVSSGRVRILNGANGALLAGPIALPGPSSNNRGGPPTVADFDGDGRAEIGVAGGHYYTVFDLARPGEEIVQPDGDPEPQPGELFVRWRNAAQDLSSNATGSSVFDFQGDGPAEVIYADECYLRVYDGRDGTTQLEIQNSTGTIIEYPIVVDVDGNGRSEIVVVANVTGASGNCAGITDYVPRRGIWVYEDPNDRWVRTRSIWNQHAYSINHVNDDGGLPEVLQPSWLDHNTFRANRQGEIPLNAPDPRLVSFSVGLAQCPEAVRFNLVIENAGLRSVPAGMPVRIWRDSPEPAAVVIETTLDQPLLPGERVGLVLSHSVPQDFLPYTWRAEINEDDTGAFVFDCRPGDTEAQVADVTCGY